MDAGFEGEIEDEFDVPLRVQNARFDIGRGANSFDAVPADSALEEDVIEPGSVVVRGGEERVLREDWRAESINHR